MSLKKFTTTIIAALLLGFTSLATAGGYVNDYDEVGYVCNEESSSMDVQLAMAQCTYGWCSAIIVTCEGPLDPDAKYRIHFDTEEPYFWQDDSNESCMTTSDYTAMYRPGRDKYTGPKTWFENIGDDYISLAFYWDEMDIEEGGYVAVWVDVHKKGIKDRVPETDEEDGCAKPQYPSDDGYEFGYRGEAMIVCAGGICAGPPPGTCPCWDKNELQAITASNYYPSLSCSRVTSEFPNIAMLTDFPVLSFQAANNEGYYCRNNGALTVLSMEEYDICYKQIAERCADIGDPIIPD